MANRFLLFTLLVFFAFDCLSQSSNIGTPPIANFSKKKYKASPQNWDATQDKNGLIYFGNTSGLLQFDGEEWYTFQVDNYTIVRSVRIADDGKIYVGAQGELGYFSATENGQLAYQSLLPKMDEALRDFADVWDIEIIGSNIYFRTDKHVLLYDGAEFSTIFDGKRLNYLGVVNGILYVNDIQKGLFFLQNDRFEPCFRAPILKNVEISGMYDFGDGKTLVSTIHNGLYILQDDKVTPFALNDNGALNAESFYCSAQIDTQSFALGTSTSGIFIFDKTGKILRHFDRNVGLQTNNVLSLFSDKNKNLWACLDNGIDFIETSSPFSLIYPDGVLKATGYAVRIHQGDIYFGTSNGLYFDQWKPYYNPIDKASYRKVRGASGQVLDLSGTGTNLYF